MSRSSESGVVIVLFTLTVVLMIGFIAIAIGYYEAASTRDSTRSFAQVAALSALESYFRSESSSGMDKRKEAVERVRQLVTRQYNTGNTLLEHNGIFDVVYDPVEDVREYNPLEPNPDTIVLQGGRYYYEPDPDFSCGMSEADYPCFVRETSVDQPINSFKVFGGLSSYKFGSFVNVASKGSIDTIDVKTLAVSSVIPRIGCFIVDLSPSIINESHLSKTIYSQVRYGQEAGTDEDGDSFVAGHGSKNVYLLSRDNPTIFSSTYDDSVDCTTFDVDYNNALRSGEWDSFKTKYNPAGNSFTGLECLFQTRDVEKPVEQTEHYSSDYVIKKTLGDSDYFNLVSEMRSVHPDISRAKNASYLVGDEGMYYRFQTYPGMSYTPPEPLNTVFEGVRFAIEEIEKKAVSGDKVCLIFFDERLAWSRTYLPTDDFEMLKSVLDLSKPVGADVASDLNADGSPSGVPLASWNSPLERSIRFGLFPGFKKTPDASARPVENFRTGNFSNLPLGVSGAIDLIEEAISDGTPSSSYIAMITDGLSNCGENGVCYTDTYAQHRESINQLVSIVENRLVPASIPLHVMLIGDYVAPHTVAYKDPSDNSSCLSEEEVRLLDDMFTRSYDETDPDRLEFLYQSKSSELPWFNASSYMYTLAKKSRGIYAPIRRLGPGETCTPFEELCPSMSHMERLLSDPDCLDLQGQFERYMSDIVGENPFVIAETW